MFTPKNVQIWSWGSLKAKFREIDKELSRPGLPWHSFQNPQPLKPRTTYEFQIELQPVFKTFKKGCRIWLKIASDDALYSTLDSASQYVETPASGETAGFLFTIMLNIHRIFYCLLFPTPLKSSR